MASAGEALPKLLVVTRIRSGIRRPWWEKRTLKALGLTKANKTIVVKNSPAVNGQLLKIKRVVKVVPLRVVNSDDESTKRYLDFLVETGFGAEHLQNASMLKSDGSFDMANCKKYLLDITEDQRKLTS